MPELPEVETTVRGLNAKIRNRIFVGLWSDWKKTVKKPRSFAQFEKELHGKKVQRVWRRAKNVIIDLSEGYSLLIHQKMAGHLLVGRWHQESGRWISDERGPLDEKINLYIHLLFTFDDGSMMALSDYRKFAKAELWKTDELLRSPEFIQLGPEPLDKQFTVEKFETVFHRKRGKVKQVLMDPYVIAGIGNIYSSEALWWAKINPFKDVSQLSKKELAWLYTAVQKVLAAGVKLRGESFADYRDVHGKKGEFDTERKVYKREGELCSRCKRAKILRVKIGGRSAFYCPYCQKA